MKRTIQPQHYSKGDEGQEQRAESEHSLADHISCVLVNEARSSVATKTLVHLALVSLKPGRAHTLYISTAGQRAGLGVHTVVMTDVCLMFTEIKRER